MATAPDATKAAAPQPEVVELVDVLIPMTHPDNGACDLYKTNKAGHMLVPVDEAAEMIGHGFVVVDDGAA